MTRADNIASHGRIGRISSVTIGSFGRLIESWRVTIIVEVMRLVSEIKRTMELISRIK